MCCFNEGSRGWDSVQKPDGSILAWQERMWASVKRYERMEFQDGGGLSGWPEPREMGGIGWKLRQCIAFVERHHTCEASQGGDSILTSLVNLCEKTKHRSLGRFVPEFDVVLRGIVQAAFGSGEIFLIEIAFAELAVGDGKSFFVANRPMMIEGLFE